MEVSCLEEEMEQSRVKEAGRAGIVTSPSVVILPWTSSHTENLFGESGLPFTSDSGVSSAPSLANF